MYKYIKRLEFVHTIYEENEDLNRATIENETSMYLSVCVYIRAWSSTAIFLGVINFRKMLEKYKQQQYDVEKLVTSQMLGVFHLKLHRLKNTAKPTCEYLLELVEKTIIK